MEVESSKIKELELIIESCENQCKLLADTIKNQVLEKKDKIINHLEKKELNSAFSQTTALLKQEEFIKVYDELSQVINTLKEKCSYIMKSKECPNDIRASLDTFIYATKRIKKDEFIKLKEKIKEKFGEDYITKAENNSDKLVKEIIVNNLEWKGYTQENIKLRMKQLCKERKIEFKY